MRQHRHEWITWNRIIWVKNGELAGMNVRCMYCGEFKVLRYDVPVIACGTSNIGEFEWHLHDVDLIELAQEMTRGIK